jgi:hypothetical protein
MVAIQANTLMPVGTAITIEASVKKARGAKPTPTVNIWCAQTMKPSAAIDAIATTMPG